MNDYDDAPSVGSVRVIVRFRPINDIERRADGGEGTLISFHGNSLKISKSEDDLEKRFSFDHVFFGNSTQEEIYNQAAKATIEDVKRGYNGTIFAYGQTGAGKSHTMTGPTLGDIEKLGIVPRAMMDIFDMVTTTRERGLKWDINVSVMELYNEKINDLIDRSNMDLPLVESQFLGKRVTQVRGLSETPVEAIEDVWRLLEIAEKNRQTSSTAMNAGSSRSHSVFRVVLRKMRSDGSSLAESIAVLHMVDLAGSEKLSKTGVRGQQATEATHINMSLTTLGRCIKCIGDKQKAERNPRTAKQAAGIRIPFRESVLTRILKDSLVGNCKTTLVVCCSPARYNLEETLSTLQFARRARAIQSTVTANVIRSKEELERLVQSLTRRCQELEVEVSALRANRPAAAAQSEKSSDDVLAEEVADGELSLPPVRTRSSSVTLVSLEREVEGLNSYLREAEADLDVLNNEVAGLRSELWEKEKQLTEVKETLSRCLLRCNHTEAGVSGAQDVFSHLQNEFNAEIIKLKEEHQRAINTLHSELEDLTSERNIADKRMFELFEETEVLEVRARRAESERDSMIKDFEAFEAEKSATLVQLDNLVRENQELEEVKVVRDTALGMVAQMKKQLECLQEKASLCRKVEAEAKDYHVKWEASEQECLDLKRRLREVKEDLTLAATKNTTAAKKLASSEHRVNELEDALEKARESEASCAQKLDLARSELLAAKEGGVILESVKDEQIRLLMDERDELHAKCSALERRISAQNKVMEGLEQEADELEGEVNRARAERDQAREERRVLNAVLTAERCAHAATTTTLENLKECLEVERMEHKKVLDEVEESNTALRESLAEGSHRLADEINKREKAAAFAEAAEAMARTADKRVSALAESMAELQRAAIEKDQRIAELEKEPGKEVEGIAGGKSRGELHPKDWRECNLVTPDCSSEEPASGEAIPLAAASNTKPRLASAATRTLSSQFTVARRENTNEEFVKWIETQSRALVVWVQAVLRSRNHEIEVDLQLSDLFLTGENLVLFAETLTGCKAARFHPSPAMTASKVDNINCALDLLALHGCSQSYVASDFLSGNRSTILQFLWHVFQTFVAAPFMKGDSRDEVSMLKWVQAKLETADVFPTDLKESWHDGTAFCALMKILAQGVGAIPWVEREISALDEAVESASGLAGAQDRLVAAFNAADTIFHVDSAYFSPTNFAKEVAESGVLLYLAQLRAASLRPLSVVDPKLGKRQAVDLKLTDEHPLGDVGDIPEESWSPIISLTGGWRVLPAFPGDARIYRDIELSDASPDDWYKCYFYGRDHVNIVGRNASIGNLVVSVVEADDIQDVEMGFRVLVRHNRGHEKGILPKSIFGRSSLKSWGASRVILPALMLDIQPTNYSTLRDPVPIQGCLLAFEELLVTSSFRVAVMYIKKGQTQLSQILANVGGAPLYEDFLKVMGDRVKLRNFNLYCGGLDTQHNRTGCYSVFTSYRGFSIMFHVATLISGDRSESSQNMARRLLSMDTVTIAFVEEGGTVPLSAIEQTSDNSVVIAVSPATVDGLVRFRLEVVRRTSLPTFEPPVFDCLYDLLDLREIILALAVNGEKAANSTADALARMERRRMAALDKIVEEHHVSKGTIAATSRAKTGLAAMSSWIGGA